MFAILLTHQSAMKILLSNDDGYHAEGLAALARALAELADIVIVAPDRNQSGSSHSLTLDTPLRVGRTAEGVYFVNGTPTDCVHLAITGLLDAEPDMVVSGINHGANLGDDVLYSGTVAAAIEGRFLGLPAIAVSLVSEKPQHLTTAAQVARNLVERLQANPLPADTILNVNVPDLPVDALKGYQATRLGSRHRSEAIVAAQDPKGRPVYWVGPAGKGQDAGPGTDFHAIDAGYVSITPLQVDLTRHEAVKDIEQWLTS
jgi:5'-nucleotidase